jgi:opacity protein-like surface antigen
MIYLPKMTIKTNKMKRIILAAVAVLAFGFANAQGVKFGAKAALNIATLNGDVENQSSYTGFQVGGFAEIKVTDKFFVQPELLYSTQGSREKQIQNVQGVDYNVAVVYKFAYINIPVMAKYYVAKSFSLEAGPQFGFLTSAKAEVKVLGESTEVDMKDYVKAVDFGLNLGAGYDFTEKFSAGIRYNFGLANINKEDSGEIKNAVFSVSLGYKF